MCKVLALMANRNAKASASDIAVVSTASAFSPGDNAVPTHSGGTAASQKPNADPPVPPRLSLSQGLAPLALLPMLAQLLAALASVAHPLPCHINYCISITIARSMGKGRGDI